MATKCADAIKNFEAKTGKVAAEEAKVMLYCQIPSIKAMDTAALTTLTACEHLSLSTNVIDKMASLGGMANLRVLSVGRNMIKKIDKLEDVAGTLEELWISYNALKTLDGLSAMENLTTLYASNNQITDWGELEKIASLPNLKDVVFCGNPFWEEFEGDVPAKRVELLKHLPNLTKIDGELVTPGERTAAAE